MGWTEEEEKLKTFIEYLNSIHSNIKFTHEYSVSLHQSLPFLDVQVHLSNNQIHTDLHIKPTDQHQYLLKSSCHLNHTKKTIPFSLLLRIRRICSTDHFFDQRSKELVNYLMKRGQYSRLSLQRAITRVSPRHPTPWNTQCKQQKHTNSMADCTPFVITFNPALYKVSSVLKKHLNILQSSPNCKDTFPMPSVVAYRRHTSLRDLLVHSTLHNYTPHAQQPARVYKCNHPRCLTGPFLQESQTNYIFTATYEQR